MTVIDRIVSYLSKHGGNVEWTDEPYERMAAELQDWGFAKPGRQILFVGYWYEHNGDVVPDPNITITLQDGQPVEIVAHTWAGTIPCNDRAELDYAYQLLQTIYDRHFLPRLEEVAWLG